MVLLEHHDGAARDHVRLAGLPERLEFLRGLWVFPLEVSGGRVDGGRVLALHRSLRVGVRGRPVERQVSLLCQELLQAQE
jgi:hypothetical protein